MTIMRPGRLAATLLGLLFGAALLAPVTASAKGGDDVRLRFYGWVEQMPERLHGTWVIGGETVVTVPATEFDQSDGPLRVDGCAKVEFRNGVVHEIDSEPERDCR
jgi:hypothetical protein